jgi:lipid-A-disaccharide synthase
VPNPLTIYFVSGETSGDNHGAALMHSLRSLRSDLRFIGRGGPRMKEAARDDFLNWSDAAGIVGLWEVIKHYGYFREQFRQTLREVAAAKPDAIILIDYPGFNLRLAKALRRQAPAAKIIYYISPQVWAWNRSRIPKMARWLDLMLCIFPFESELYEKSGLRAVFVGHPMIESLERKHAEIRREPNLIGLFPGSRQREVRKIFPVMMKMIQKLRCDRPELRFEIAAVSENLAATIRQILDGSKISPDVAEIVISQSALVMQRSFVGVVASGTATLEAAYYRLPFILIYKVSWMTYLAGRLLIRVKYLGMPNVLADREIVPEFIQHRARAGVLAKAVASLLSDSGRRQRMISELDESVARLGGRGASERAARAVLHLLCDEAAT